LFYDQGRLIKVGNKVGVWHPLSSGLVLLFTAVGSGFAPKLYRIFVAQEFFRIDCSLLLWHQNQKVSKLHVPSVQNTWNKILTQLYSDHLRHSNGGGVDSVLVYTGCSVTYWPKFGSVFYR
jgi:hypothetical protein